MANNPFDPPIVKIHRTLQRGGMAGANRGAGSVRGVPRSSRPAPGPQELSELTDVDGTVVPADGDTLVYDGDSGLWVPAGSIKDRRWVPGPGHTTIDEFNEEAVDGSWVRVDAAGEAGHLTYTESGGVLSLLHTGTDAVAETHALMRPVGTFGIGDTIETCMVGPWGEESNYPMGGLVLADGVTHGAGTQVMVNGWWNGSAQREIGIRGTTSWDTAVANTDVVVGSRHGSVPLFLRLSWLAANSFGWEWSYDGVSWIVQSPFATTLMPTHLGLMVSTWGGTEALGLTYEYLRSL